MFFFYSLDDTQLKEPASIRQWTLPSMLERQGDFSQSRSTSGSLITVRDPLNNNAIRTTDPVRPHRHDRWHDEHLPVPNSQGAAGYNFVMNEPSLSRPRRQWLYRFDLRPTDKDSFSIKHQTWYTHSAGIEVAGRASTWGVLPARYDFSTDMGNLSYTRIISPSIERVSIIFYSTEAGPAKDKRL
jgi:hypothetical protein